MLLVIDSGNTRTKWALVNSVGVMQGQDFCMNGDLGTCKLPQAAQNASKVFIANVAGESVAEQIAQLVAPLDTYFVVAKQQACDVINLYEQTEKLGADRWAALIAAWHLTKQATLVVNAGTAITIDCLANSEQEDKAVFLGGTIMPGLRLMQTALMRNTAQLSVGNGVCTAFPINTQNAMQTGCLNAVVGAIAVQMQQLQKRSNHPLKVIISGGDAAVILAALQAHLNVTEKQVMIIENLVLQGLVILQKEII